MEHFEACSFWMLFGLWGDVFNIILGIGVLTNGDVIAGIGYILTHLASLLYLVFHRKFGVKYHEIATRTIMIVPQTFCIIHSFMQDNHYRRTDFPKGLILLGLGWSLTCAFSLIIKQCCRCTRKPRRPIPSKIIKDGGMKSINNN